MADGEHVALGEGRTPAPAAEHASRGCTSASSKHQHGASAVREPPSACRASGRGSRRQTAARQSRTVKGEDPAFGGPATNRCPQGWATPHRTIASVARSRPSAAPIGSKPSGDQTSAEPQPQGAQQEGQRGQRDQGEVQEDADRRDQVEPQGDQGQGGQPDDRRCDAGP